MEGRIVPFFACRGERGREMMSADAIYIQAQIFVSIQIGSKGKEREQLVLGNYFHAPYFYSNIFLIRAYKSKKRCKYAFPSLQSTNKTREKQTLLLSPLCPNTKREAFFASPFLPSSFICSFPFHSLSPNAAKQSVKVSSEKRIHPLQIAL